MRIIKKIFKWFFITLGIILVLLMILPYFFSIEQRELPLNYKPYSNSEFYTSHNTRIHYQTWKPDNDSIKNHIVFIHGFSGSTFSFRNNIDTLVNNGNEVVAIDMPAFGYSDKSEDANYNDTIRLQLIKEILDKISPNQEWVLIGHSMGASIIGAFACNFPENTNKLVFIDGPAFDNTNEQASILNKIALFPPIRRWVEVLAKRKFVNYQSFNELLSSAYSQKPNSIAILGYLQPFYYKGSASAIFNMSAYGGYAKIDKNQLAKFPMLLIWGKDDQWIPIGTAEQFKEQNPTITLKKIEKAGHCSMETHANSVNSEILNFLNN
jgi:pimeloyl-ACP methyl ester carboxylesterase